MFFMPYIIWFRRRPTDYTSGKVKRKQRENMLEKYILRYAKCLHTFGDQLPLTPNIK